MLIARLSVTPFLMSILKITRSISAGVTKMYQHLFLQRGKTIPMEKYIKRLTSEKSTIKVIKKNNMLGVWIVMINGAPYAVDAKSFKEYYKTDT